MRRPSRRGILVAGGTLLAAAVARKSRAGDARAGDASAGHASADPDPGHPPVQRLDVVKGHLPMVLPALSFGDADGRAVSLESYRGRGVVLNLWATWCVPCVAELPSLDGLSRALAPSGVRVLTVSLDHGGAATVGAFYAAHGIRSLPVLLDPHGASLATLGLDGIPVTLLIDAGGREVARVSGSVDWADPAAAALVGRLLG